MLIGGVPDVGHPVVSLASRRLRKRAAKGLDMRIWRAAAAGAVLVAGLGALGACGWDITKERASDETNVTERITAVRFANDAGNVSIRPGDSASVHREIHYEDELPGVTHRVENGVLILEDCPETNCWIDYELVVPADVRVDGAVESGNAEVRGVAEVNLRASSGDVVVDDVDGAVNVEASSGNVELDRIGGDAQVQASSGNVTVALVAAQDVRVNVASGNVEVTVPQAAYRLDAVTGGGHVDSDIKDVETAEHHLDLRADSGNIEVRSA
jgi:hypothetical protein